MASLVVPWGHSAARQGTRAPRGAGGHTGDPGQPCLGKGPTGFPTKLAP